jgi:hypothetical protein
MPIKINNGTANNVVLVIIPKTRLGKPVKKACSKEPLIIPIIANISEVPARVNATGNPNKSTIIIAANNRRAIHSIVILFDFAV